MQAYIVSAVRTAGGKRKGALANWHPNDLGGLGNYNLYCDCASFYLLMLLIFI